LFGGPADEVTVAIVERAARMDAKHPEPGRLAVLAQPDRYDRRVLRRKRWSTRPHMTVVIRIRAVRKSEVALLEIVAADRE
jgi:hypothetical protein